MSTRTWFYALSASLALTACSDDEQGGDVGFDASDDADVEEDIGDPLDFDPGPGPPPLAGEPDYFEEHTPCLDYLEYQTFDIPNIGFTRGHFYDPACLRVLEGQTVYFYASSIHPLEPSNRGTFPTPIPGPTFESQYVTFDEPGFYTFFCEKHGSLDGGGMSGVIWVEPAEIAGGGE